MLYRHEQPQFDLPAPLVAKVSGDQVCVSLPEGQSATFVLVRIPALTRRTAAEVLEYRGRPSGSPTLVSYQRASVDAREALRAAGVSFVGEDGRVFLRAPGILVDRSEPAPPRPAERWRADASDEGLRNPFAKRSSRVPRWLLLHPERAFALAELAGDVDLNPAAVSRVVRALEESAFVVDDRQNAGGRSRHVRLQRPGALLDAWLPLWQNRRITQRTWDIGAHDADGAIELVKDAMTGRPERWAVGGLSGAAAIRRVVEPADVVVWTSAEGATALAEALLPAPGRSGRGAVRVCVTPDPWILGLARAIDDVPVTDLVQLWLDCASGGERALEAAEAVADTAGWT
jgi:hypothetical protein